MRKELAELEEDVRRGEELVRRGEDLERRMAEAENRGASEEELQAMLDKFGEASGEGSAGGKVWGNRNIAKAADDLRLRLRKLSSIDDFLADDEYGWMGKISRSDLKAVSAGKSTQIKDQVTASFCMHDPPSPRTLKGVEAFHKFLGEHIQLVKANPGASVMSAGPAAGNGDLRPSGAAGGGSSSGAAGGGSSPAGGGSSSGAAGGGSTFLTPIKKVTACTSISREYPY